MKKALLPFLLLGSASLGIANIAPTVIIQSAEMRPGTTLMDVVYRVNDPDDATVKTRALAFVDGVRSFANVIRPVTFVEGTAANLGDAIPANVEHTLTWDVAADWDVDLGQVKFEVLAMDDRGLLPFDWITIPAAGGNPELTVSKNSPTDAEVLNALFWRYADGDTGLSLENGVLKATSTSGIFSDLDLVSGVTPENYAIPFILSLMDLDWADGTEMNYAATTARVGLTETESWHASNRPFSPTGEGVLVGWGSNDSGQIDIPLEFWGFKKFAAIAASRKDAGGLRGDFALALRSDGTVTGWGSTSLDRLKIPVGLSGVTAISAGNNHSLALKSDGTVVGWGQNVRGQLDMPEGLSDVTAIAAGSTFSLALKSDGTVVAWGSNSNGQLDIPEGLSGVTAIATSSGSAGIGFALKNDGTVVAWGASNMAKNVPVGLTGVTAIAAGLNFALALKDDGTLVGWGQNVQGQLDMPEGLSDVTAIAAGSTFSLALKSDGTVVGWGKNDLGQIDIPTGLSGVTLITAGTNFSIVGRNQ